MATLTFTLPAVAFPHELDQISIEGGGACAVVVKMGGVTIFSSTLYFDDDGFINIYNFAEVIRSYAKQKLQNLEILLDGASAGTCDIIPCAVDLDTTAIEFCSGHFLTRCGRHRTTTLNSEEYLSLYTENGGETVEVMAVYHDAEGKMRTVAMEPESIVISGIVLQMFKVADIAALCEGDLVGFTVHIGQRQMEFIVKDGMQSAERLRFRNCFGEWETLAFAEVETKLQTKYDHVRVRGLLCPYKVEQFHEYKYSSGYLMADEIGVFEDLAISAEVVRVRDGTPLTVTGCDFVQTTDLYQATQCKLTLRESSHVTRANTYKKVKTFDKTFDSTFD